MAKVIIDPWGAALPEDYESPIKEFGLERFNAKLFPKPNKLMRRGVVFAGRGLEIISQCIREKKPFYTLSGIMPSGERIHLGNKMVIENMRYFQDRGARAYIIVADLEAAATRGVSIGEARRRALEYHIPAYIALGLDPKKTVFYFQSENLDVIKLAYEFAKKITFREFQAIYGSADPGRIMSALTQAGDILFPQLEERMPGIVPIGIDQDPHIRLTRDIVKRVASKYSFFAPSSIYHKFTPSMQGELKMSKSRPEGCIDLPDAIRVVKNKIMRALTGGRSSLAEQKKKGGAPEKCVIFEFYKQHLIEEDKKLYDIFRRCKAGNLVCGDDKKLACELMESFMKGFLKKVERARKNINKLKFTGFSSKKR